MSSVLPARPDAPAAEATTGPAAVATRSVDKTFRLPHQQYSTLKERVLHPLRFRGFDELRALRDVSFAVAEGEFFGIVGRNGSGKSTLLKCLAGIYDVDGGEVEINGRLSPFIELGVGFNPDLTARDNVIINAIMLGLTRQQARDRFDDIVAFAELGDFLDLKLKNYSSGMNVRLAFATAIQVDADIILVDEVLAVGDAAFQQKCFEEFHRLKRAGRTIVFVTHDMGAVERFCDRAMLIDRGAIVAMGEPAVIARKYNELNFGRTIHTLADDDSGRYGDQREAEIVGAWIEDVRGERVISIGQGERCELCFEVCFHQVAEDPVFGATLRNDAQHTIFATSSQLKAETTGHYASGACVTVRIGLDMWLAPSRYGLTPSVTRAGSGADALDLREDMASLLVHGSQRTGGVADLPHDFRLTTS